MKKNVKYLIVLFGLLFFPVVSFAAITFTDGKWETTFNCDNWESRVPSYDYRLNCDGMVRNLDKAPLTPGERVTTLSSVSNNPSGAGGKGVRFWKGSGGDNILSGDIAVNFPTPQKELWIRWYEKYEAGFKWNNSIDVKSLYFKATDSNPYVGYQYGNYRFYWGGGGGPYPVGSSGGWDDVYGTTSDGTWHCFEVYMKMDTNGTDGVGRTWVDGELVASQTGMNWSSSHPHPGWDYFHFLSNQKNPGLERPYYVDVDDMVIYNTTPPNRDANGNPFIGPIGGSDATTDDATTDDATTDDATTADDATTDDATTDDTTTDDTTTSVAGIPTKGDVLASESFENNNWTDRGWYDGTNSTGVASGGVSGNALKWDFGVSDKSPDNFSVIRRSFNPTDEFLLEYYVKFDSGWRGSGQNYHPHFLHVVSSEDTAYQGLSRSNSGLYFETVAAQSTPYTNYPQISHQDMYRVNTSAGTPPNNLSGTTENRSANQCNTPYSAVGGDIGTCYNDGVGWYSATTWRADSVAIPANTWTKITAYIKNNTFSSGKGNFDGIMRLWVGDKLAIESTNVLFAAGAHEGATWDKIALAPWIGDGSPIAQSMWLDELSLWTVSAGSSSSVSNPTGLVKSP